MFGFAMPELPEVECFRRHLETHLLHHTITQIRVLVPELLENIEKEEFIQKTANQQIDKTFRHGKFLFLHLSPTNIWVVIHFGMTGFFRYTLSTSALLIHDRVVIHHQKPNDPHDSQRVAIFNDQRKFGLMTITESPIHFMQQRGFGPDALELSSRTFQDIISHNSRKLKVVLMDQQLIAGIGNLYSDEMCFQAQIHPFRSANSLSSEEINRLYIIMRHVLTRAIENDADIDKFPAEFFINLREKGKSCSRCNSSIQSGKVGGRMAYFCPQCQKL